jgi:hypothetical protein
MHFTDKEPDAPGQVTQGESPRPRELPVVRRRRFPRWVRWLLWPLLALLLLLGVTAAALGVRHKLAVDRLAEATAALDAAHPGWRLEDLEAARAEVPDDENSAPIMLDTVKLLPKNWPPADLSFPKPDAESPPNRRLDKDRCDRLRAELDAVRPARASARRLAKYPNGRFAVVYARDLLVTLLPHAQEGRKVFNLLALDAALHADDGELAEATLLCRAALNAARSLGDEPILITQMVRLTGVRLAGQAVERVLGQGEPDEADLAALQAAVEQEARHPGLLVGCRGDRAMMHHELDLLGNGEFVFVRGRPGLRPPEYWDERWFGFLERDTIRRQHAEAFPLADKIVEIAEAPAHQRQQPLAEYQAMLAANRGSMAVVFAPALEKVVPLFTRHEAYLGCLAAALAAERYRRARGDWPPSLEALAPRFLGAVPLDPSDAQPLSYAKTNDGVVIYSAVADSNGLGFDPDRPSPPGEGVAVRLWDPEHRGKSD